MAVAMLRFGDRRAYGVFGNRMSIFYPAVSMFIAFIVGMDQLTVFRALDMTNEQQMQR